MKRLTDNQLMALVDLRDGQLHYGISVRGRRALPSLVKRGMVAQLYGKNSADQWHILAPGFYAMKAQATIRHLRP